MAMQTEMAYQAPPSPTLTNPDMILPDMDMDLSYGGSGDLDSHSDALMMWKNSQMGDLGFSLPGSQFLDMNMGLGLPSGPPITPTTPIIYGNGTMLSDIGEVTEAESTVGHNSRPPSPMVPRMTSRVALRTAPSEPTMSHATYQSIKAKARAMVHERRSSIDSTSTVRTVERGGLFEDFDDVASVGDSVFQGDDEESVAESYNEGTTPVRRRVAGLRNEEDRLSTVSIGRRAEEILANAKRRLTTMEGNLNRARSSLYISTDDSLHSDGSTPSPPILDTPLSPPVAHNNYLAHENDTNRRSASALGAAGGYRHIGTSRSVNDLATRAQNKRNSNDSFAAGQFDDTMSIDSRRNSGRSFLSPHGDILEQRGLVRSTSAMQMRDIKDQVEGLKDKVSALREKARADSLKRQSIASLRLASPFTHAQVDQWYSSTNEPETPRRERVDEGWAGADREDDEAMSPVELSIKGSIYGDSESEYEDASGVRTPTNRPATPAAVDEAMMEEIIHSRLETELDDDMRTEDGFEERAYDSGSDSGDSLYHDAKLPLSHEDREDAFDYEHFFLHSAMGTMSQRRLERNGSFSSEDSVETTRGPLFRRNSAESISTMASFETANEGRLSKLKRNNSDGSVVDPREIQSRTVSRARTSGETFISASEFRRPATSYRPPSTTDGPTPRSASSMSSLNSAAHRASLIRRPLSTSAYHHRPSVSSFDSTGTNRSFPLVSSKNRLSLSLPKNRQTGIPTPRDSPSADDFELGEFRDRLIHSASMASMSPSLGAERSGATTAMGLLSGEDQALVEGLVASFGQCVLKLSESGRVADSKLLRGRMEKARRILEGEE